MNKWIMNPAKIRQYVLLMGDVLIALLSFAAGLLARIVIFKVTPTAFSQMGIFLAFVGVTVILQVFSFFVSDLYNLNIRFTFGQYLFRVGSAVVLTTILSASVFFFAPRFVIGRTVLLVYPLTMTLGVILWRYVFFERIISTTKAQNLALIGMDKSIKKFLADLSWFPVKEYHLKAVIVEDEPATYLKTQPIPVIKSSPSRLQEILSKEKIDILVYSVSADFSKKYEDTLLSLQLRGYHVYNLPDFYGELIGKIPVHSIDNRWVLDSIYNDQRSEVGFRIQRVIEIILALGIFILTLPIFGLIALAIKLDSKGPVLFRQKRLGYRRSEFELLKFRTMVENAEAKSGPTWTYDGDPRITRVGNLLRKTGFDELPQLINILKGEMTYVGFRPIRKHFADILAEEIPYYDLRFIIRPGVTGWPQIQHNYAGSVEGQLEKFEYELFYLQNASFLLDGFILLKTIQKILGGGFSNTKSRGP